jgi:hypothetical protein
MYTRVLFATEDLVTKTDGTAADIRNAAVLHIDLCSDTILLSEQNECTMERLCSTVRKVNIPYHIGHRFLHFGDRLKLGEFCF